MSPLRRWSRAWCSHSWRWRRLIVRCAARSPRASSAAANPPPALTSGSWWWSPTRMTLAPARAGVVARRSRGRRCRSWRLRRSRSHHSTTACRRQVRRNRGIGVGLDAGAVAEFAGCSGGWCDADQASAGGFEDVADGVHCVRLARSRSPDDDLDGKSLGADASDGVGLVGAERSVDLGEHLVDECRVERLVGLADGSEHGGEVVLDVEQPSGSSIAVPNRRRLRLRWGAGRVRGRRVRRR